LVSPYPPAISTPTEVPFVAAVFSQTRYAGVGIALAVFLEQENELTAANTIKEITVFVMSVLLVAAVVRCHA
jgi:hypothetical protein